MRLRQEVAQAILDLAYPEAARRRELVLLLSVIAWGLAARGMCERMNAR